MTEPDSADVVGEAEAGAQTFGRDIVGQAIANLQDTPAQLATQHLVTFGCTITMTGNDSVPVLIIPRDALARGWEATGKPVGIRNC